MTTHNQKEHGEHGEHAAHVPLSKKEKQMLWARVLHTIGGEQLAHPRGQMSAPRHTFFGFWLRFKTVLASLLVVALVGSSAATVSAADDAVPGDVLFPIDIAVEKVQLIFASGNKKATLRIVFAEERLKEAQQTLAAVSTTSESEDTENDNDESASESKNNSKNIKKAENALTVAASHLEKEKERLLKRGNGAALAVLEDIMGDLDEAKVAFKDRGEGKIRAKTRGKGRGLATFEFEANEEENEDSDDGEDNENDENENGGPGSHGRTKVTLCHIPPGNPENAQTIRIAQAAARVHVAHGDILETCAENDDEEDGEEDKEDGGDENDDTATTSPDTTAPTIGDISVTSTTTSALASWTTDDLATSTLRYGTAIPLIVTEDNTLFAASAIATTSHSAALANLTASTTYYFLIEATDESGNTATTSEQSFTTLP